jgi:hypothetical protein
MSPLVFVALVALRARWLAGLISSSAGRTAAPVTSSTVSTTLSTALNTLRGSGGAVSQFFVWFYLVLGAILGITLLSRVLGSVIDEIKLQRELYQPPRPLVRERFHPRTDGTGPDEWGRGSR